MQLRSLLFGALASLALLPPHTHVEGLGFRSLMRSDAYGDGGDAPFTCDDMTEGLCDLDTHEGELEGKGGYKLRYYTYIKKGHTLTHTIPTLVGLHGGPGGNHWELVTLKQQACATPGRMVLLYDQTGAGESDRPTRLEAPWLFTIEYYMDEFKSLLNHLNIKTYYMLGHSWGGVVVQYWAALEGRKDKGMAGIILSSTLSDAKVYAKGQYDYLLSTLPPPTYAVLQRAEETRDFKTKEYIAVTDQLTRYYTTRIAPWPNCVAKSNDKINEEIYVGMQGASEFTIGGVLEDLAFTPQLKNINVPTLITSGAYDTMTPPVIDLMHKNIPHSEVITYPHSGHMTMHDDVNMFNRDLAAFMQRNDGPFNKKTQAFLQ